MKKIKNKSLTTLAYEEIRKEILHGKLSAGSKLNESELAKKLDVSRTVVQRALMRLIQEGLVEKNSNFGQSIVKKYSKEEIIEIWELRVALEGIAAEKAALNRSQKDIETLYSFFDSFIENKELLKNEALYRDRDRKFHKHIIELSQNNLLMNMLEKFNIQIKSFEFGLFRKPEKTIKPHLNIIRKIEEKKPKKAKQAMENHLNKNLNRIKRTTALTENK